MTTTPDARPSALFVCVHNAGRSQMAAGFRTHLSGGAVEAMLELGIDIRQEHPKALTTEAVQASDVVITMGCGDVCPIFPGKRYEDWKLDDPAGQGIETVRPIRDEIRARVLTLLGELGVPAVA